MSDKKNIEMNSSKSWSNFKDRKMCIQKDNVTSGRKSLR